MSEAQEAADSGQRRKLELLEKGYDEVLDAVKHQDDKIGRLLTGLSFLTAATLAVAGLGTAKFVTRRFTVGHLGDLPLALIFLGVFVGGVVVAVSLLLAAFSTPLRLPGQRPPGKETPSNSTIYFYDIARQSLDLWSERCGNRSVDELEKDRIREFTDETHNLAARAKYKHDRVTEATTIVVTAMLALILAAILTLVAAADQHPCVPLAGTDECGSPSPLHITWVTGLILGVAVAVAVLIKYHTVIRNQRQTQEELEAASRGDWLQAWCTAFVAGSLLAIVPGWGWCGLLLVIPAHWAGLVLWRQFSRIRSQINELDVETSSEGGEGDRQAREEELARRKRERDLLAGKGASTRMALVVTGAVALCAVVAAVVGDYGARLAVGVSIYGVLGLSDFVRSLLIARRDVRKAKRSAADRRLR